MARAHAVTLAALLAASLAAGSCGWLRHRDAADHPAPVDLNRASLRKIEKLPGVTPSMARRIVDGRPYGSPHDLVTRGILTQRELDRVTDLVTVEERQR